MNEKDIITIICPVYNQQDCLKKYIRNLKAQTYGFHFMQIIFINDGSVDLSGEICARFVEKYKNILYIEQENRGVSAARNAGLKEAVGKYIFFIDADDLISKNTIADCVSEFNKIYDRVDLLTYPIETYYKGRRLKPHFRYQFLKENGSYDLCSNAFIGQTTMNIVVKNKFEKNVLFDETLAFSEDQKYCCEVLRDKLEMGFCKSARYIYNRSDESSSGKLSGACYIFEPSLKLFEDLFARYESVPLAFQGLFVNDIYWKMLSNIFFPYHYSKEEYRRAMSRVKILLKRCDNFVILSHPNFDFFEKFYLMKLKGEQCIETSQFSDSVSLLSKGNVVLNSDNIEIVVTKLTVHGTKVRLLGFLKSVFFQFYKGSFELYAIENGIQGSPISVSPSAHNYYLSHEPTQRFWKFEYECDAREVQNLWFKVKFDTAELKTSYYFMPLIPIHAELTEYIKDRVKIIYHENQWYLSEVEEKKPEKEIWLYYDCSGVTIDNGLKQFCHDIAMSDGIDRYYVLTDKKQNKYIPPKANTVIFGSKKHVELLLQASKIITAFIENNNVFPFPEKEYSRYANQMHFETIYLQHGVLHIDMPWKYSPEKIIADKIVVACDVDYRIFRKNGFAKTDLWKVGLPRFDELHKANKSDKQRILYAPSWRSYLVGENVNGDWKALDKKFLSSRYYMETKAFLESDVLYKMLEKQEYTLDVKVHPIFQKYADNFIGSNDRIHLKSSINEEDYSLMITDFSSYMFDFLYLGTAIFSFIPDYQEFKCGMNGYRNVDFMTKIDEEEIAKTSDEIINKIEKFFMTRKGMLYDVHFWKNDICNATELIYQKMTNQPCKH